MLFLEVLKAQEAAVLCLTFFSSLTVFTHKLKLLIFHHDSVQTQIHHFMTTMLPHYSLTLIITAKKSHLYCRAFCLLHTKASVCRE